MTDLARAIESYEVPVSPSGLREAMALRDRLDARVAVAVGAFDAEHLGDEDCGLNTQSWLRHKAKVDHKAAGRLTALGRRLHRFADLRDAALDGRLSGGQLAIVTACVPERHFERFAEHQAVVVAELEHLGIDGTRVLLQSWLARADALDEPNQPAEKANQAWLSKTLEGRGELRASTDADRTARMEAALRIAEKRDFDLTKPQRRADALEEIFNFYLDHQDTDIGRRHRPHVNVVMTYEQFLNGLGGTYLDTGQPVGRVAAERFRCDSYLHRVLVDSDGAILDYGRATRAWRADLYNAIVLRDGGCRWPGCDLGAERCDAHHTEEWVADEGQTSFWYGVLACDAHHDLIHRKRLHLKLLADGTLEITWPDGHTETTKPRGPISPHLWDQKHQRPANGS
jgi:hypothetical protein